MRHYFKGKKMLKYFIFMLIVFGLNGCISTQNLGLDNNLKLENEKKISTFDSCTNFSYISQSTNNKYDKLFIEYINLDNFCKWNGLQRGYFVDLFKSTIKAKSFRLIERIEHNNSEYNTYLIDEKYYVNIIYKYTVFEDLFIIDYAGIYTTEQIQSFDKSYNNLYLDKPRFSSNYSNSLVRMNFLNSYFTRESEGYEN